MDNISWEEFSKVKFRVGEIIEAINVESSDKLIRMMVDLGELGQKIVFSGIRKHYSPEQLIGKKTVFVVNMIPKKIMGEESGVMIFGAANKETMSLLLLDKELENGSEVF